MKLHLAQRLAVYSCLLLAVPAAHAGTIVSVSGPNDVTLGTNSISNILAVGFSTGQDYYNVDISVSLVAFGDDGTFNLDAYLTNRIGTGTTAVENEYGSYTGPIGLTGSALSPPYTATVLTLFMGIFLPSGQHYLVLNGSFDTTDAFWMSTPSGSRTDLIASGDAITDYYLSTGGIAASHVPSGEFAPTVEHSLWFNVTGEAMTSPVPEPGTLAAGISGCLLLAALRWKRR